MPRPMRSGNAINKIAILAERTPFRILDATCEAILVENRRRSLPHHGTSTATLGSRRLLGARRRIAHHLDLQAGLGRDRQELMRVGARRIGDRHYAPLAPMHLGVSAPNA
jgi:hypothetical protein